MPNVVILAISFFGGVGINMFSNVTFDLLKMSRSHKEKMKAVLMSIFFAQMIGPFLLAYFLLWQLLMGSNKNWVVQNRLIAMYLLALGALPIVLIGLYRKISKWRDSDE